jgi:hypothetical protein
MRLRAVVACIAIAMSTGGCRATGLIFHDDHHLTIVEPARNSAVRLPLTVRWTADPVLTSERSRTKRFVVFVDRPPIKPGQKLRAVAGTDEVCRRTPGCPDEGYLARNNVYVTAASEVTLIGLPNNRRQNREGARDAHVLTIILIDASGERVDERAYSVEFTVDHLTCLGGNGSRVTCR